MAICGYNGLEETGLYYLQSCYYNPQWGRFINADGLLDTRNLVGLTAYINCSANAWSIIAAYYLLTTGQLAPSPSPSPMYA